MADDEREGGSSATDDEHKRKQGRERSDDDSDDEQKEDGDDEEEDKGPPLYKRPIFWVVFGIAAAVIIVGGTLWWLHARRFESTDDAFVDAHIVRIAPEISGKLTRVANADNRHVEAGQLLAEIEASTSPQAQLAEARAGVLQARAQVLQAEAQVNAAIAQRRQAAANADSPAAEAGKAQRDYERYQTLLRLDPEAVAGTQLDQARATAASSTAQAVAARRQVSTADAQVESARKNVIAARAQVKAAEARVAQADVTTGQVILRAPVSGQVVNRQVNLGSYVGPGTQLMALIPDRIWVTANFKETQLAHMRLGQPVAIRVDAFPGIDFVGHVDSIQRGAGQAFSVLPPQNATGNYVKVVQRVPVRILFDIGGGRPDPRRFPIGPGMSVVPTVTVR